MGKKRIFLIFSLIVTTFLVAIFCFGYFPQNSFALGVKIGGEKVGGLSREKAKLKLEREINHFLKDEINFIFSDKDVSKKIVAKMEGIGVKFDIDKNLEEPFWIGKRNKISGFNFSIFFKNIKEKILALQGKYNFPLKVEISDDTFEKFLTENFGEYEILPVNAGVLFDEKKLSFKITEPKEGLLFEKEKIKKEIEKEAQNLTKNDVFLVLEEAPPEIQLKEATKAKEEVEKILNVAPYILIVENKIFLINKKTLGNWFLFSPYKKEKNKIELVPMLDENLIENYLGEISLSINIEPKNPVLTFKEDKIQIISPPKTGEVLNIKESAKTVQEKILEREEKIFLSLEKQLPKITEEKIKELEIEILVGKGVSNFAGSPKNRIHNIKIGASKFNGVLIAPGEEFSFNKILGEVDAAQGYLPELVIKRGETVPEYGGGICQVSTTMFRAAVNSGMKITERHPHAYPVRYYSPQGFDATVYLPSPDLRFKNNTPGYILIQSKIEGTKLTFEFYGKDDKRKVIIKGPYVTWTKPDGSMGTILYQEVWKNGKLFLKGTFKSSYKSPKLYPILRNPLE